MLLAVLVSTVLVLAAPFIGELRRWLAATLPGQYVWIINGVVGAAAIAVVLAALVRIRHGRVWRFGFLVLAAGLAVAFAEATGVRRMCAPGTRPGRVATLLRPGAKTWCSSGTSRPSWTRRHTFHARATAGTRSTAPMRRADSLRFPPHPS
jgi:hypothetical protein